MRQTFGTMVSEHLVLIIVRADATVASIGYRKPVRLRSASFGDLWFSLDVEFRVVQGEDRRYRATVRQYAYTILDSPDGDREIIAYHWTPDAPLPQRPFAHLHVGASILSETHRRKPWSFQGVHVRTEPIAAEHVVRMLFEEFGVVPLTPHWEAILARSSNALRIFPPDDHRSRAHP